MCDPFDAEVPTEWREAFGVLIKETPNLDWLLLTKRPENVNKNIACLDNVWLGVSVENQEQADKRIPILLSIPARVRFLSVEPLLGPVNLNSGIKLSDGWSVLPLYINQDGLKPIDWVIVGGESGPNRRDCGIEPLLSVVKQCTDAGVPVFTKQDCALKPGQQGRIPDDVWVRKEFPI